jgi:hypothetical protein
MIYEVKFDSAKEGKLDETWLTSFDKFSDDYSNSKIFLNLKKIMILNYQTNYFY